MQASQLSGWWRLWIVLSLVLGTVVFAATFDPSPSELRLSEQLPAGAGFDREEWLDDHLGRRQCTDDIVGPLRIEEIDNPNAPQTVFMSCTPKPDYAKPIGLALIPGAVLLALGLIFAWVRAGFGRGRPT